MLLSLKYYNLMGKLNSLSDIGKFLTISNYYPPFFYITTAPIISLLGFSEDKVTYVNFLYLILLVISLFALGKFLFNKRVGIVSSLLLLFYPIMYAMSREYLIDFALVSLVTVIQYVILKSEGGLKEPWNILLGILLGLTLLTKPVSIIFFLPTWIYIFLKHFNKRKDFLILLKVFLISLLISGTWYLLALPGLINTTLNSFYVGQKIEHDPRGFIEAVLRYNSILRDTLISPNLLVFLFLGFIFFIIFDKRRKIIWILLTWIIPAYFILVLTPNKDPRYIMPLLPAFALLSIGGIESVPKKIIKNILFLLIIGIGLIQFNNLSFNLPPYLIREPRPFYNHPPYKQNWRIKEIVHFIADSLDKEYITIGILPNCRYFNPNEFILYSYLFKLPFAIVVLGDSPITQSVLEKCDTLITKTFPLSVSYTAYFRDKFYNEFNEAGSEKFGFKKMKEFDLPDNSSAIIYRKIKRY